MKAILEIVKRHKSGQLVGITSICSANPFVIEASLRHSLIKNGDVLIEATSNQVNQDGGYTGMRPENFISFVYNIADKIDFPKSRILFGGDHLGPNCWQNLTAEEAMAKSEILIEQYVKAGFRKIHLDCSMACQGDPEILSDELVARRAAQLCKIAENTWEKSGGEAPVYIIGTEVPVPGGAKEELNALEVTSSSAALKTIEMHKKAFIDTGLENVWSRVVGVVVQPGVEFDHHKVIDYEADKASALSASLNSIETLVFEAHSTDYQTEGNLKQLVKDHFAILKVGPGLTFALREVLWAMDEIESQWQNIQNKSNLRQTVMQVMHNNPKYWKSYYSSEPNQQRLDMQYSLSDRIRYYWPDETIRAALKKLEHSWNSNPPSLTLLSQFLPLQYQAIRNGQIKNNFNEIILNNIGSVLDQYYNACHQNESTQ
ncbi:MAG: D-tagatose-bisphosphate aldolase, class II, non-catalytic subunit [Alphaproteobacteria bacterium]|nr:D-tagatose-bisphosphate aldolase, class II, non-catalytic subunit [Alphaproteobacteria bacterium]HPF46844.1 D-tagatose-bisphosphate aldolase, class II, non-catalytic subunit [Emcibacteraceae bacterium]HRW28811.1 D-tagatose-bisphosphate aldolase, class II, non-catalytic subunit [Emcibacteraceae bacterium]